MWLAFLDGCSYPRETCSGPKFLKKEFLNDFFFFPLGEDDLFGMSRLILALIFT